jgi:hypothetical protein
MALYIFMILWSVFSYVRLPLCTKIFSGNEIYVAVCGYACSDIYTLLTLNVKLHTFITKPRHSLVPPPSQLVKATLSPD